MVINRDRHVAQGMNFEDDGGVELGPGATELSTQRMRAAFKAHSNLGVMTEGSFEACLRSLGPFSNRQFAKLLFRVCDANK
eukprot:SAG11_NODE_27397_length_333_cov_0.756410_1_plen_80_part_01